MTIDVLICSFNKGVVKIEDVLLPPRENVRYIISYQYTDESYLEMLPASVVGRSDVLFNKYKGQGLSNNRNQALALATADLVLYADDDTRLSDDTFRIIFSTFEQYQDVDIALFRVSSYTGRWLKEYPENEMEISSVRSGHNVSTIEIVFRRNKVQGVIRYDERFGLGTKFLTCGEGDIWLCDAIRHNLKLRYFPYKIAETSSFMKQSMIYVDAGVQRSYGAYEYYTRGRIAWLYCLSFAWKSARKGYCHFYPMLKHLYEGIRYINSNK